MADAEFNVLWAGCERPLFFRRNLTGGSQIEFINLHNKPFRMVTNLGNLHVPPYVAGLPRALPTPHGGIGHRRLRLLSAQGIQLGEFVAALTPMQSSAADSELAFAYRKDPLPGGRRILLVVAKRIPRKPLSAKIAVGITNGTSGQIEVAVVSDGSPIHKAFAIASGKRQPFVLSKPPAGHITFALVSFKPPSAAELQYHLMQSGGTDQGEMILLP